VFLGNLTAASIKHELNEVERNCYNAYIPNDGLQLTRCQLREAYFALSHAPTSAASLAAIPSIWSGLEIMEGNEASLTLYLRMACYQIMMTNFAAWLWLEDYIVGQAKRILNGSYCHGCDWLFKLMKKVVEIRSLRLTTKEFHPHDFSDQMPGSLYIYNLPHRNAQPWDLTVEQEQVKALSIVVEILQAWLSYPTRNGRRQKAWFAYVIHSGFGDGALWLEQVWKGYYHVHCRSFDAATSNNQSEWQNMIEPFQQLVCTHVLHDPRSEEGVLLSQLSQLLHSVLDRTFHP
jgi:hypothetical protein